MSQDQINVTFLKKKLKKFAEQRNWMQFHSPKNISMALSVEASELLEIFQWLKEEESWDIAKGEKAKAVKDEIADILLYTIRLADLLEINIGDAIDEKFADNEAKYPPDKAWGSSKKYTEYD